MNRMNSWRQAPAGTQLERLRQRADSHLSEPTFTPNAVVDLCREFCHFFGERENGPAHVVVADFNTGTDTIARCIIHCIIPGEFCEDITIKLDTIDFLAALLLLDDDERLVHGDEGYEYVDVTQPPFKPPAVESNRRTHPPD
jgi:hypothetical protein